MTTLLRRCSPFLFVLTLAACDDDPPLADAGGPPPGDGAAGVDGAPPVDHDSLADRARAVDGGDLTIAAGEEVVIDADATLGLLTVEGVLRCAPGVEATVRAEGVLVHGAGALFECGSEDARFTGKLVVLLTGHRDLSEALGGDGHGHHHGSHDLGAKAVVAMHGGRLSLFGDDRAVGYARLEGDLAPGETALDVDRAPAWRPGDQIVVSTTSFRPEQSETFTLAAIDGARVTLDGPAAHRHFGRVQTFTDEADDEHYTVDQRAYVANLTRHIVIASDDDAHVAENVGAHVMVMDGGVAQLDAVELTRVGQLGRLGRYPLHWHLTGDVSGQFVRGSSIHGSFNRCVTLHGAQRASVVGNTCFDHRGHGIFLEDGNETGNEIAGNLGILSRKVHPADALLVSEFNDVPGDRFPGPATFWIAHPDNDVHHNVAVGSEGSGFWMSFRTYLRCDAEGCSPGSRTDANVRPRNSNTLRFDDNTAMSCVTGITWDGAPDGPAIDNPRNPGGDFELINMHYAPPEVPTFSRLHAYKNAAAGIYFRGEQAIFEEASLADNGTAIFVAYNQVFRDTIIVGASDNMRDEDWLYHLDPTVDSNARRVALFEGIRIYDGPFVLENVFFAGFPSTEVSFVLPGGARFELTPTPLRITGAAERWTSYAHHVTFETEPLRRYDLRHAGSNWQDAYTAALLDVDGAITGAPGTLVRPRHPLNQHPSCVDGPPGALHCSYELASLRFDSPTLGTRQFFHVTRSDGASFTAVRDARHLNKIAIILGTLYDYAVDQLDFGGSSLMRLRFTTPDVGDLSPLVRVRSVQNLPCALSALELVGQSRLANRAAVEAAAGTAYAIDGGELVMRIQATQEKPQMSPGTPIGDQLLTLRCGG